MALRKRGDPVPPKEGRTHDMFPGLSKDYPQEWLQYLPVDYPPSYYHHLGKDRLPYDTAKELGIDQGDDGPVNYDVPNAPLKHLIYPK